MAKGLTLAEKETIIRTSEAEKAYSIYTHNKAFQRRLDKLAAEHPKICKCITPLSEWGDATYLVAKDNVILTIKAKRELTAAEVEARKNNILKARAKLK